MKTLLALAAAVALAVPALAKGTSAPKTLAAGKYSAHVKALVCEGCAANVEQTLKTFKGLDGVSVDQAKSEVAFEVEKGAKVSVAKLQKALKASSEQMGMGADYTLRDIRLADAK